MLDKLPIDERIDRCARLGGVELQLKRTRARGNQREQQQGEDQVDFFQASDKRFHIGNWTVSEFRSSGQLRKESSAEPRTHQGRAGL